MILFINACVRDESRTKRLADQLLKKLEGSVEEVVLSKLTFPTDDQAFLEHRDRLIAEERFDDPLFDQANQFARADVIVIAAPYWDLSFPAALKQYFEQINVVGVTFRYTEEGIPVGLCKAKKLYYVMTAGGFYVPEEFGFGYVQSLAENYYGIRDCELIKAVGLDIVGTDVEGIMQAAFEDIDARFAGSM